MGDWGASTDRWGSGKAAFNDRWGATAQKDDWRHSVVKCNACSEEGHEESNCPNQHIEADGYDANDDKCFNCGEPGHRVADCPTPRDTSCRYCKKEGHMLRDCPDKPALICENCGQEGHMRKNCENARVVNRDHIADKTPDDALAKIRIGVNERDMEDIKEGVQEYVKSVHGDVTYRQLQTMFIDEKINLWLIATERELMKVFTNMDIQGNMGKKYSISYRFSDKADRPREREGWPQNLEEILDRLDDAGEIVDVGLPLCRNCNELGHVMKNCPEERREHKLPTITCSNCSQDGHRLRDCPEPRVDKFACRNCGKSGHRANDCPEPPNLDNMECRRCGEMGHMGKDCPQRGGRACRNCGSEDHMARDCDQPRNMDNVTCRNCEQTGHFSRDCPEPKDWSKVQCSNCQQYGHTKIRCKEPIPEEGGDAGDGVWPSGNASGAADYTVADGNW
ncbi:Zinc finger, CCHC retroviral-type [Moelleriella libera RCEF 2490]|uniref:Zinc finger, CCHC retroviral-type n=1 Tax=Moelleriella libera RCEF 2490 TaxID=1081109 RepID=A0A166VM72_9HYPO|nr:Zinc finger, CCHC retroviral-type [Moelleriella libera RCEF 2490]